jgi:Tol biopolymer transport system component
MRELQWTDRDGTVGVAGEPRFNYHVRLSPDEKHVALVRYDWQLSKFEIWTLDLATNIESRFTFDSANANRPVWSPDSRALAFDALRNGTRDLHHKAIGGLGDTVLFASDAPKLLDDWSRDGEFLLFRSDGHLYAIALTDTGRLIAPNLPGTAKHGARFSPDGKWVSYGSNESGDWEVYVASFPAFESRRRISPNGGAQTHWRGDGRELFYLAPDGKMMSVAVSGGDSTQYLPPTVLFQSPIANPSMNQFSEFDVVGDGQRFLFVVPQPRYTVMPDPIVVVVNWQRGLER